MRPPPGPWWQLLWLLPSATLHAGAVRGEEAVAAALSGNLGTGGARARTYSELLGFRLPGHREGSRLARVREAPGAGWALSCLP